MCQSGDCDSDLLSNLFLSISCHNKGNCSARLESAHSQLADQIGFILSTDSVWLSRQPVGHLVVGDDSVKSSGRLPSKSYLREV